MNSPKPLSDYIRRIIYKYTHVNDFPVECITSFDENGVPEAWIDLVGGVHDGGCGTAPDGTDCGECDRVSCEGCGQFNDVNKQEEENERISES